VHGYIYYATAPVLKYIILLDSGFVKLFRNYLANKLK